MNEKGTPPTQSGDDEMERAIQLSLKEQNDREQFQEEIKGGRGYKDPENPFDRKRESLELPAGIKNVGNTCYINSLLQAIFMLPEFRINIFDLASLSKNAADRSAGERLIHELQLLFTRMLLTNRRYVDPSPLLEFTSHHGAQEDPTELFLALLEKIRDGASKKLVEPEPESDVQPMDLSEDVVVVIQPQHQDIISRFFEGVIKEEIEVLSV